MSAAARETDARPAPRRNGFRVLALSGGGYLGLYTAAVLAGLEQRVGEPIGRRFDLVAGTSVGGITAAAVAMEVPLSDVVELFVRHGAAVFSPRALPSGPVGRLVDLSRSVFGPKYGAAPLREQLQRHFASATFADARHALVVPAVNLTRGLTKVFKTPHAPTSRGDEAVRLIDAVMATCAAPAYFPSVAIGGELFADGGLFAVAPDQVALHEVEHFVGVEPAQVRMLSVGTAIRGYRPDGPLDEAAGAVGWLSRGRLILTLMAAQQQHVQAMMEDRLGARYLRLDATWAADAALSIDVATPQAAQVLTGLAERTLAETDADLLSAFL
jgi:predicted acylesterase/phospholipase RssA